MLHQQVFRKKQEREFCMSGADPVTVENAVLCKRSRMRRRSGGLKTSEDFREHQANTFAASMLMPPRVFIPYVQMLMQHNYHFRDEEIMMTYQFAWGKPCYMSYLDIVSRTAHRFKVSTRAVCVQLSKYGLQANPKDEEIREARRRLKMYQSLFR